MQPFSSTDTNAAWKKLRFFFFFKSDLSDLHMTDPIYPTTPLGQDMTQGQFLSGV